MLSNLHSCIPPRPTASARRSVPAALPAAPARPRRKLRGSGLQRLAFLAAAHAFRGQRELVPGDLVFQGFPARHVGIYVGKRRVLHASRSRGISLVSVRAFTSARRVFA